MYLYRATGDPYLLEIGEDMLRSIQASAKTSCGYATVMEFVKIYFSNMCPNSKILLLID